MNTDARQLSTEQQELLRQKAIQLREKGKTFRQIGQLLDVHPDTVGRWYKRYQTGGAEAIAVRLVAGSQPATIRVLKSVIKWRRLLGGF